MLRPRRLTTSRFAALNEFLEFIEFIELIELIEFIELLSSLSSLSYPRLPTTIIQPRRLATSRIAFLNEIIELIEFIDFIELPRTSHKQNCCFQ